MGVAVDGLCHPAQACKGTNGVRSPVLPQQRFSLSGAGQMISVCAYHASLPLCGASTWRIC